MTLPLPSWLCTWPIVAQHWGDSMSDVLSLAEITEQRAELLPARAVMSSLFVAQEGGDPVGGLTGGGDPVSNVTQGSPMPNLEQINLLPR